MKRVIWALAGMMMLSTAHAQVSHVSINERQFELGQHPSLKLNIVSSHSNLKKVQFSIRQASGEERLISRPLTSFMVEVTGIEDVVDKDALLIVKEYRVNRWYQVKRLSLFNPNTRELEMDSQHSTMRSLTGENRTQSEVKAMALKSGVRVSGADVIVSRVDDCQVEFNGKESLWRIANRQSQRWGISPYGSMLAIFEANPKAFNRQSIHGLKAKAKLECPSMTTLEKYADAKAAEKQFDAMK
ncbi:FimV/HubP family polar landmark protein [uncultured Shewanella sp.]|uniref:FimV/HubP family polar landmark protein n=1 Tax=uncultured Shewanella sp. TaxID=173975 RepID=UPI0026281777|nr:FimV/HubP family polar landmark protein [uncultured Shewanella sp.]